VIIRENRAYDQILGDVVGGNGDPSLAVFGDSSTYAEYPVVTPNAHALVQGFPLFDNYHAWPHCTRTVLVVPLLTFGPC